MTGRDEEITGKDGDPAGSGALNERREKLPRIESARNHAKIATPLGAPCASNCGKKFPGESESEKRRVLIRQVCVNTRKSSAGSSSIKISKTASDKVTTGALSKYGESSHGNSSEYAGKANPRVPFDNIQW